MHTVLVQTADRRADAAGDLRQVSTTVQSDHSLTMRGLTRLLHLYQARLTARVPGIEHHARRLVPYSAETAV